MSMSRKDYNAIADILGEYYGSLTPIGVIANSLARYFETDNERFDYNRFMNAVCLKENK